MNRNDIEKLLDNLYTAGYNDADNKNNYDPRGCQEWFDAKKEFADCDRMDFVIAEHEKYNRIGNDLDAYLLELIKYAAGKTDKPNKLDYGLNN